jgi:hypothetical protein
MCACCGERNNSATGGYRRVPLERMKRLRKTASPENVARWERIARALALLQSCTYCVLRCLRNCSKLCTSIYDYALSLPHLAYFAVPPSRPPGP